MNIFNKIIDILIVGIFTCTAIFITDSEVLQYLYTLLGLCVIVSISTAKNYK